MGAEVYAFTSSESKVDAIKKLGADHVVVAQGNFHEPLQYTLDILISTRDVAAGFPMDEYMSLLVVHGRFVSVGLPDDRLPGFAPMALLKNGAFFGGSHIGSKAECLQMLDLAAKKGVKPWIELLPMKDVQKAIEGVKASKAKYRYVLTQDLV
jgi:alcohol dehydrogenase (NADP+)